MSGVVTINSGDLLDAIYPKLKPRITSEPEVAQQPYSYIVFTDGARYYAKSGTTGQVELSSDDASVLLHTVVNRLKEKGGGRVFVRGGTYVLKTANKEFTEPNFQPRVAVYAEGANNLEIICERNAYFKAAPGTNLTPFMFRSCANLRWVGGVIDGDRANQTYAGTEPQVGYVLGLWDCDNATVRDVTLLNGITDNLVLTNWKGTPHHYYGENITSKGARYDGIIVSGYYTTAELTNVKTEGNGVGIEHISDNSKLILTNFSIDGLVCRQNVLLVAENGYVTPPGNAVITPLLFAATGPEFKGFIKNVVVEGANPSPANKCIYIAKGRLFLQNVRLYNSGGYGIEVRNDAVLTFIGGEVVNHPSYGIWLNGRDVVHKYSIVKGVRVTGCGVGIQLSNAQYCVVVGNVVYGNTTANIAQDAASANNVIANNATA